MSCFGINTTEGNHSFDLVVKFQVASHPTRSRPHGYSRMTPDLPCAAVKNSLPAEKFGSYLPCQNGEDDFVAGVALLHWTLFYKLRIRYKRSLKIL